ncbi:MAG: tetratricopeptide repeat protein, partial [Planctomycetota bacterium]
CITCLLETAALYLQKDDSSNARQKAELALARMPSNPDVLDLMIKVCVKQEDYAEAISYSRKRLGNDPTSYLYWYDLGSLYLTAGQLDQAEETFLKAQTFAKDDIASLLHLFDIYKEKNKLQLAESILERAIFINPRSEMAHRKLVEFLFEREDFEKARESSKAFLDKHPKSVWAHFWTVNTLVVSNDFDSAIKAYKKGAELADDFSDLFSNEKLLLLEKKIQEENSRHD